MSVAAFTLISSGIRAGDIPGQPQPDIPDQPGKPVPPQEPGEPTVPDRRHLRRWPNVGLGRFSSAVPHRLNALRVSGIEQMCTRRSRAMPGFSLPA